MQAVPGRCGRVMVGGLLFATWACTGRIAGPAAGGSPGAEGSGGAGSAAGGDPLGGAAPVAPSALRELGLEDLPPTSALVVRRLNRIEYDNTIADLLGDTSAPARAFPRDEIAFGFDTIGSALTVPPVLAEAYVAAAETLARTAVSRLDKLVPCAAEANDACAARLISELGARAYRRPLADDEVMALRAVYEKGKLRNGFATGVELVLRAMLVSPDFLFRVEVGTPSADGTVRLGSWEIASRLSYFLWQTMPDEALVDAARRNALVTAEGRATEARRMLRDPRARATVRRFTEQWLGLQPLAEATLSKQDAGWSPAVASSLHVDVVRLVEDLAWGGPGGFAGLFRSRAANLDERSAAVYGLAQGARELDARRAGGVLARAGLLARFAHPDQTSPTHRGVFVRQKLLCESLPPPPPSVNNVPSTPRPNETTRERAARHVGDPSCNGCHRLLDPIGFVFEHFDQMGRWRDDEGGRPIDARGEIVDTPGLGGAVDGVPALGDKLAGSPRAAACFARQWLRFALGREESQRDSALLVDLTNGLGERGDVLEMLVAIASHPLFASRAAERSMP